MALLTVAERAAQPSWLRAIATIACKIPRRYDRHQTVAYWTPNDYSQARLGE